MPHAQPQGSLMYVLTLTTNHGQGTVTGTYNPAPGETRYDAYRAIRRHALDSYPHLENGTVLFFCLEPNTL
ncbi:hypothetical protein [Streptomyces sp. NPDC047974]|uniref:hypothetical protein n=1 Tax=Streptomyces sp. NPDC047974 TaxID=3154343 RepID=UPI0033C0F54A